MRLFRAFTVVAYGLLISTLSAQQQTPAYRDPTLSIDDRVRDLLTRMTLEEKIDQITGGRRPDRGLIDTTGRFPPEKAEEWKLVRLSKSQV